MSAYSMFKTDRDLEQTGVWLEYFDDESELPEFCIKISRAGGNNRKYTKTLEAVSQPHRRALALDLISNQTVNHILLETFSESVVLDWKARKDDEMVRGIEDPNTGEILPVTPENVVAVFKALPDLFEDVQKQASSMSLFRESSREKDSENSSGS